MSALFSAPPAPTVDVEASEAAEAAAEVARSALVVQLGGAAASDAAGAPADAAAALRELRLRLEQEMSAAAATPAVSAAAAPGDDGIGTGDLSAIDLGFTTEDEQLDHAAKILRMLYVEQLRKLQSDVNGVIATAQNYTADPRTDSRLGKVGRG